MKIEYDESKRQRTLVERGLDFADAGLLLSGYVVRRRDDRFGYGETRWISVGTLERRIVVVVWTERGDATRIISMRLANEREREDYRRSLGGP